jgi:hypothetical protein
MLWWKQREKNWQYYRLLKNKITNTMDSRTTYKIGLFTILFIGIIAVGLSMNHSKVNIKKAEESYLASLQKRDSLETVIDSLQTEIFVLEDGCDYKEHRYENVIDEYEMGMDYLKKHHPTAYKDFNKFVARKQQQRY